MDERSRLIGQLQLQLLKEPRFGGVFAFGWMSVGKRSAIRQCPQTTSILKFATLSTFHYSMINAYIHHP
jgi:hypothetical protein